ncbi:hypothetical protein B0T11DRAFT_24986 [Plectosphaerella cucumerina]|uniref:Rhodopsin domain-containing protein n=1 Tax=Plectosphaerella cucumerina TaxID=40658 RepID=A0A8K0TWC7_9PEZI|nr:hypothetical protein B0T11DRAFT_24986 [Plectosphaerella cucumerina]
MDGLGDPGPAQGDLTMVLTVYLTALSVLSLVVVGLRFHVRIFIIRKVGMDDWATALACMGQISVASGTIAATQMFGLGRHMHTLTRPAQSNLITAVLITSFGYHFVLMILKAAFLLQYRRSFPLPGFQRLCDIFLIFLLCWTIAGAIAGGSTCKPGAAAAGIVEASDKTCEEGFKVWLAHGVINIITDVLIYIMPLPLIKTLPLSKGQKIALFAVFSLGFFTCVISGMRLSTLRESIGNPDSSWVMANTVFYSMGELTAAIVCLCVPTLRPLLSGFKRQSSRQTRLGSGSE